MYINKKCFVFFEPGKKTTNIETKAEKVSLKRLKVA